MTEPGWGQPPAGEGPGLSRRTPVADLFEETFGVYRRAFWVLVAISAIIQVPMLLATIPMWAQQSEWYQLMGTDPRRVAALMEEQIWPFVGTSLLLAVMASVLGTFGGAAMVFVADRTRGGARVSMGETGRAVARLAPALLGYLGLLLLAFILAASVFVALVLFAGFLAAVVLPGSDLVILWSLIIAVVACIAGAVILVRLILTLPALVLEDRSPIQSVARSWELVRGSTLRTFGIFLIAWVAIGVVASVVSPVFLPGMFEGLMTGSMSTYLVLGVVSGLVNTLAGPIIPVLMTLLYHDYATGPIARS